MNENDYIKCLLNINLIEELTGLEIEELIKGLKSGNLKIARITAFKPKGDD